MASQSRARARLKAPPQASLDKLLFDTIVHGRPALEFLISSCRAERVLLGSDYRFDMGTLECAWQAEAPSIVEADKATSALQRCDCSLFRRPISTVYLLAEVATSGLAKGLYSSIRLTAWDPRLL